MLAYSNAVPGSSVAKHSTQNPMVKGLSPSTCIGREKTEKALTIETYCINLLITVTETCDSFFSILF
jgi:hypothetical protein